MNKTELKYRVMATGSNFFNRKTMKFFGDKMSNYGIRETTINTWTDENLPVFELYRRHAVKHGLTKSAYFDKKDFERRYAKR